MIGLETMFSTKRHKMAAGVPQVGAGFLDARQEVLLQTTPAFCVYACTFLL